MAKAIPDLTDFDIGGDDKLDKCISAYRAEYDRWCWRRNMDKFELVRDTSPNGNINADEYQDVTRLTKRECRDSDSAEDWLNTYRERAAMKAALEAL